MDTSGTKTLPDLLREKARLHPEKDLVVFEDASGRVSSMSYSKFAEQVDRLANALVAEGVRCGQKIALMLSNSPEFLVSWFGINQAGAVMVPVNVFYSADELRYLLISSDSVGLIVEPKFVALFSEIATDCPDVRIRLIARSDATVPEFSLLTDFIAGGSADFEVVRIAPESASQIVYTSGTTSRPKGAVISHRSSVIQGIAVATLFGMRSDERTGVVLPLFHVNGQYVGVIPTITVGGTIVLLEAYSAGKYWNQVRAHRCTLISIVPMQLRTLLAQPRAAGEADHRIRFCFYALPTTDDEWDRFEQRFGVRLVEGYGLTETLGICTANSVVHSVVKRHCIGLPVLGREVRVVGESNADLSFGEVGRILVRGQPMFSGYYRNPEASEACMVDGWFDTGDNGSFDDDGYVHFFDRSKDVIKRAGENIAATEVERVLNEHPKIMESAVIGIPDPLRDEAVKAFVVLRPAEAMTEEEVKAWCAGRLSKFKVPSVCEFRSSLPKTSIGKIMKYVLKKESANAGT